MSFQVLARKWRPKSFADVVGQGEVIRTLTNALSAGRVAHAYLFAGVRGTGKTTAARILARALNCVKGEGPTAEPCGECDPCREILAGSDLDLYEIDGASHTGVDNVRDLIENVRYSPARNRYKVFIVDEVHMLSMAAFNALLKTIEEPPAWVVFILATTEIHKIPATILSRCQQFPFRRLETSEIEKRLVEIATAEKVPFEPRALAVIAEAGNGSLRDALSILDQAITFGAGKLETVDVERLLGRLDRRFYQELLRASLEGTPAEIVRAVGAVVDAGGDPRAAWRDLGRYARGLLLAKAAPGVTLPEGLSETDQAPLAALAAGHEYAELLRVWDLLVREDGFVRRAEDPRLAFELVLLKIRELGHLRPIEEVLRELGGGPRPVAPPVAPRTAAAPRDEEAPHPPRFTRLSAVKMEPDPAAAPPPPPPTGSIEGFRARLEETSPRLGSLLSFAERITLEGRTLRICFSPAHASNRDLLEGARNREELLKVAEEVFGTGIGMEIVLMEPASGSLSDVASELSREELAKDRLRKKVEADKLVQTAIELFRGEITDVADDHGEDEVTK